MTQFPTTLTSQIAHTMAHVQRQQVCRNGGDEFLYLLTCPGDDIAKIAHAVIEELARPITFGELRLSVNSSIGIAIYPGDGRTADELVNQADVAMYEAKRTGGGIKLAEDTPAYPMAA